MRKIVVPMLAVLLAACGKSADDAPALAANGDAATQTAATATSSAADRDPCTLVADPQTLFGTEVTASLSTQTGQPVCEWKSADGRICGSVTWFTPAPNASPDPKVNFAAMAASLKAFGEVKEVPGIGEEARMVDGGMLGAQVALRTSSNAALAASACRSGPYEQVELAQRLAREIAGKL